MIKINLVPKEILDRELQRQRNILVGAAAAALLLFGSGFSWFHWARARSLKAQLAEREATLKTLEAKVALVEELERQAQALRTRLGVINDLMKLRSLYPRFMEDILRSLPGGIWLNSLGTQPEGVTLKVNASAKSLSSEDVAEWIRRMESSDRFSEPALGPISITESPGQGKTLTFTMTMKYAQPAPGAR